MFGSSLTIFLSNFIDECYEFLLLSNFGQEISGTGVFMIYFITPLVTKVSKIIDMLNL